MRAKVTSYHLSPDGFTKIDDTPNRKINVVFDEDMYINPISGFVDKIDEIKKQSLHQFMSRENIMEIQYKINEVLTRCFLEGCLFLKDQLAYVPDSYIVLKADPNFDIINPF